MNNESNKSGHSEKGDASDCRKAGSFSALKGMFSFFTMIPIDITQKNIDDMNRKFWLVPFVGVFFGSISVLLYEIFGNLISVFVGATISLFMMQLLNRFLHLDGMIDVGDGLVVAGKREDHIRALKDTLVGAGGIAIGMFVTLLTVAEFSAISLQMFVFIGFSIEIICRNAQVSAAAFGIAGNGMAGDSVRFTDKSSIVKSSALTFVIIAVFTVICNFVMQRYMGIETPVGLFAIIMIAIPISVLCGYAMAFIAKKNFGIVNGDVLGATNESARAMILIFILLALFVI